MFATRRLEWDWLRTALDLDVYPEGDRLPAMQKVLIVDDELSIRKLLTTLVNTLGNVEVEVAGDGQEALAKARAATPDLIISDINMPLMDGLSLCQAIREDPGLAETHLMLLTARSDPQERYEGLSVGADDYIVKPFDPIELQLRIKTHLRRAARVPAGANPKRTAITAGPAGLDVKRSTLTVYDQEFRLTAAEFSIMRYLAERPDELVTVADLLQQALHYPPQAANPAIIHTHVRNIRAKLKQANVEAAFLSSSRQGYMLVTD